MALLKKSEIFIVIPAFNEAPRIGKVLVEASKYKFPVIVVDDGSIDKTLQKSKIKGIVAIRHKINLGKGAALKTGCEAAFLLGAKAIIVLDADGQHDPRYINKFFKKLTKGDEVVFGYRRLAGKAPLIRFAGNRIGATLINLIFGIYRQDLLCGYIAFTKSAYQKIKWKSSRYGIESEVVARTGKNKLQYSEVLISTIYIDKHKGVSIFDALSILPSVIRWRFD